MEIIEKWALIARGSPLPSSKRTKNSILGVNSSSSIQPTPTSNKYNPPSPTFLHHPIGQKATKRMEKENIMEKSNPKVKFNTLTDGFNKKVNRY